MIAVLFSEASRSAYAAQAHALKETYTFTDAWGMPRTWLKGERRPSAGWMSEFPATC